MIPRRQHLPSGRLLPLFLDSSEDVDRYADEMGMRRDEAWAMVRGGEIVLRCEAKEPEFKPSVSREALRAAVLFFLVLVLAAILARRLLS